MEVRVLAQENLTTVFHQKQKIKTLAEKYYGGEANVEKEIDDITETVNEHEEIAVKLLQSTDERDKEISDLKNKLNANERRIAVLEAKIKEKDEYMEKKFHEFKSQMDCMQNELQETKDKQANTQTELTGLKNALHGGQLAYDFENELAKYIYPSADIPAKKKLSSIKEWLEKDAPEEATRKLDDAKRTWEKDKRTLDRKTKAWDEAQRKWDEAQRTWEKEKKEWDEAKKKWEDLKKEFSWSSNHEEVFFKLIKCRIIHAHPNVYVDLVKPPETFEEKCINDMKKMTDRAKKLRKGSRK